MSNTWVRDRSRQHAAYVPALGAAVFDPLNPQPGGRILDLGCGEGTLTERIAASGATVVGIDASEEMIAGAMARDHDAMLDGVHRALAQHGFTVRQIDLIPRPTPLPTGIRGWLDTFERATLDRIPQDELGSFLQEVEDLLRPEICDSQGHWTAHYVRLRFMAHAT